jgi:hypothetical protein
MNDKKLKMLEEVKYLGVILDSKQLEPAFTENN